MIRISRAVALTALLAPVAFGVPGARAGDDPGLRTESQRLSYTLGVRIGQSLKHQDLQIDAQAFARAVDDVLRGADLAMTREEMQAALNAYQQRKQAERKAAAETALAKGKAFLEANAKKPGVVALPDGLQYKVLQEGKGPKPTATDTVSVHYRGTLLDGTEFDSSYKRGTPTEFRVGGVIKGWQEALQLMPVGSKWQLWIPPELAYGTKGAGGVIGPNEVLSFEVELLEIKQP